MEAAGGIRALAVDEVYAFDQRRTVAHCHHHPSVREEEHHPLLLQFSSFLGASLPVSAVKQEINDSVKKLEMIFNEVRVSGEIQNTTSQEPLLAEVKAHSKLEGLIGKEVFPAS